MGSRDWIHPPKVLFYFNMGSSAHPLIGLFKTKIKLYVWNIHIIQDFYSNAENLHINHILIAFLLAEKGYNVWLGNARGTTYSRKHVNLTTSDPAYWRFW